MSRRIPPVTPCPPMGFAASDMPWPPRFAEAIGTALGQGLDVEFRFTREDVDPWFRLRSHRGVVHVLGPDFGHLATMASIPAAVARGWEAGGVFGARLVRKPHSALCRDK